ncbi:hypothetical protein BMETH_10761681154, partial [methanotrophic bacterial endosymbiont of Bathymodiolus sp.]
NYLKNHLDLRQNLVYYVDNEG